MGLVVRRQSRLPSFAGEEDEEGGGGAVAVRSKMNVAPPHSAGTVSIVVVPCCEGRATAAV